ncbi:MAG: hypothetical protein SNJ54_14845, partial [Anaerolineae bacterium]
GRSARSKRKAPPATTAATTTNPITIARRFIVHPLMLAVIIMIREMKQCAHKRCPTLKIFPIANQFS